MPPLTRRGEIGDPLIDQPRLLLVPLLQVSVSWTSSLCKDAFLWFPQQSRLMGCQPIVPALIGILPYRVLPLFGMGGKSIDDILLVMRKRREYYFGRPCSVPIKQQCDQLFQHAYIANRQQPHDIRGTCHDYPAIKRR